MATSHRRHPARPAGLAAGWHLLVSVRFAVTVVVLIAGACVVGTLLPQGADVARYLKGNPAAEGRMEILGRLGLTHVFSAWWFVGLLSVLSASVVGCSSKRFATLRCARGYARGRALGSLLTHVSILLILGGGIVRGIWGERGYLELREGETKGSFIAERGSGELPFALHLTSFEIETYADATGESNEYEVVGVASAAERVESTHRILVHWPESGRPFELRVGLDEERQVLPPDGARAGETGLRVKVLRYEPDFVVVAGTREITSRSREPVNPAVLVEIAGSGSSSRRWLFAKYPDFSIHAGGEVAQENVPELTYVASAASPASAIPHGPIKEFRSRLELIEDGRVTRSIVTEVNRPFRYEGYSFYQSGYNPDDLAWTSLQVVRDPGIPIVYAGFLCLIGGLFIVFYLNPWLNPRGKST